jgi:hypothetical protein
LSVDGAVPYLEKFGELGYNENSFCWSTTTHLSARLSPGLS